jgi:hypothetical protein
MEMTKVESSNIKAIGWEDEVLEVEFVKGGLYRYTGVPKLLWDAFKGSASKGKFFHAKIRPNQHNFKYKKVEKKK